MADSVLDTWLVPSAARASKAACSGDVSGTVLSSYNGQLTVVILTGFMRSRHVPSVTKCGGRDHETKSQDVTHLVKARDSSLDKEGCTC